MILNVHHSTTYRYQEPLFRSIQLLRLTPLNSFRQKVIAWYLDFPGTAFSNIDWYGNIVHLVTIPPQTREINIVANGQVESFPAIPNYNQGPIPLECYLKQTPLTGLSLTMEKFVAKEDLPVTYSIETKNTDFVFQALTNLSRRILAKVEYKRGLTDSGTTAKAAFELGGGVCQDHTHIFLGCCRYIGIPARYVSGYLYTTDTSHIASHAWAEAWINGAWHSFDISNQCQAGENHIELAYGIDYLDACPIKGSRLGGGNESLTVLSLVTNQQ